MAMAYSFDLYLAEEAFEVLSRAAHESTATVSVMVMHFMIAITI